jgi:hypothetical protein
MGIRSDVGVAFKYPLCVDISKLVALLEDAEIYEAPEGILYVFRDIKWYVDDYAEISRLYKELQACDSDTYLIIEACHDYPNTTDNDIGCWHDNPWQLAKWVSASIAFTVK